jgi:hypothetical protein
MMVTFLVMILVLVSACAGWAARGALTERELSEAQRLRDEAWDLRHG